VESLINEDIHVELLELLGLYCELLLARFGLLEQNTREPDPGVKESVCSIIHAAPRTELKELHILRDILMHKFGREFSAAVMDNHDNCVSDRVMKKLSIATPPSELVDGYLTEIAKAYSVEWMSPVHDDRDDNPEGGVKEPVPGAEAKPASVQAEIQNGIAPDSTPNDIDNPSAEGGSQKAKDNKLPKTTPTKATGASSPEAIEDDFEALSKRFAALKKR